MKIQSIEVEQFGIWRNLSLPLKPQGLNVFYGPNEAGKSTLMKFIRGVLYGFQQPPADLAFPPQSRMGSLKLIVDGQTGSVARIARDSGRGRVGFEGLGLDGPVDDQQVDELVNHILCGTNETVFENVFAFGLREIQQLATLEADDVERHIYGLSLGADGQRLLSLNDRIAERRRELFQPAQGQGKLFEQFRDFANVSKQIDAHNESQDKHRELSGRRDELTVRIEKMKRHQDDLRMNLRGHKFMDRVWKPWSEVHELEKELRRMPQIGSFPNIGPEQFDEIEAELEQLKQTRSQLMSEASRLKRQSLGIDVDSELRKEALTIQSYIDEKEWIEELAETIDVGEVESADLRERYEHKLRELGEQAANGHTVNTSPSAHYRLIRRAEQFQQATRRKEKFGKRIQRLADQCHKRGLSLSEKMKSLGGLSIEQSQGQSQACFDRIAEVSQLRLEQTELQQRQRAVLEQLETSETRLVLPGWVQFVLWFFVAVGVALTIGGVVTGLTTNWFAGLAFVFLGATFVGMAWGGKSHFEGEVIAERQRLHQEHLANERRLTETQESLEQLSESIPGFTHGASETELMRRVATWAKDLEQMADEQEAIKKFRRRLSEMRVKFQDVQRDLTTHQQEWCELLIDIGLPETLSVPDAIEAWHRIAEVDQERQKWKSVESELKRHRSLLNSYKKRIEALGRRMNRWDADYSDPVEILNQWEDELRSYGMQRSEKRDCRREEMAKRREAAKLKSRIRDLKIKRSAILVQSGAADREDFQNRASAFQRQREVLELLALAREELAEVTSAEKELAIVESDLVEYDADKNAARIHELETDLQQLELDLNAAHEEMGSLKHEIAQLRNDNQAASMRFDRELVASRLRDAAQEWFAMEWAASAVEGLRSRFEKNCQPEILAAASEYLERMSCGKYENVWTPLGERRLRLDDYQGKSWSVEQLSRGAREQLFLALRLAMVRQFASDGVELPLVLDDILVNFDQHRGDATIDELIDFAKNGQQLLMFTCHRHLAEQFEAKGIEPVWLPEHQQSEQRRAG